jgi:hypothetical protein
VGVDAALVEAEGGRAAFHGVELPAVARSVGEAASPVEEAPLGEGVSLAGSDRPRAAPLVAATGRVVGHKCKRVGKLPPASYNLAVRPVKGSCRREVGKPRPNVRLRPGTARVVVKTNGISHAKTGNNTKRNAKKTGKPTVRSGSGTAKNMATTGQRNIITAATTGGRIILGAPVWPWLGRSQ